MRLAISGRKTRYHVFGKSLHCRGHSVAMRGCRLNAGVNNQRCQEVELGVGLLHRVLRVYRFSRSALCLDR